MMSLNTSTPIESDGMPLSKKSKMQEDPTKIKIKKEIVDDMVPIKAKKSKVVATFEPQDVKPEPEKQVLVFEWTVDELNQLVTNLSTCLPKTDSTKYSTQIDKLDWEKVKFSTYTASQCKEKWSQVMTRLRRFRTLTDMVVDAKEWVKHPWSSFTNTKKQKHPDLPKKPLTPYFRYFLEKREKYSCEHPEMSMTDLAKILSKKFQQLNDKKKQRYKDSYEREIEVYKTTLEKFKREHPEEFTSNENSRHTTPAHEGPDKPSTPFQLFQSDRLTRPEYMELDKKGATERIRKQWNALSDGKRIKWIRKAVQDEQRFAVEVTQYAEANPAFKVEPIKSVLSKAEKELKDRYDGKPERPPNSGYSLFSKIMLRELKDVPSKEKMAEISKRWKILSEADRMEYNKQAMKANQKYKEKYAIYLNSLVDEERLKVENEVKQSKRHTVEKYLIEKKNQANGIVSVPQINGDVPALPTTPLTPSRTKKPFSAIFLYQQEKLSVFSQKHPNLSRTEITRLIAKEFAALSEKKKEKYKKLAEEASKRLSDDAATAAVTKSLTADTGNRRKLFKGEPKKPPQSGYGVFSSEMLSILTGIDPKNRMSEIAKRWKCMNNVEKEKYKKKAQELLKKYNKELHKFLSNLSEEELKEYYKLRAKGSKKLQPAKAKPVAVKVEVEKKESESDSSEGEGDDDDSSDDGSEQSDNEAGSGSGSEESGSDSDDSDDEDEEKKPEAQNESSSGDSDSDSESGSGSSDDSSDSGSESE